MKYIFLAVLMSSCLSDIMDDDYRRVDTKLNQYIESFKYEASIRGIKIDDSDLKLYFGNAHGAAAVTYYDTNSIVMDSTTIHWTRNPEEVLYHEFGHLFLHRGHDDRLLPDGTPASIMSTYATVKYAKDPSKRKYYIDELFNKKAP